jgi:probable rRNA maturation factor
LLLHGLLHLAGFDHETDSGEMAARETELRQRLGLPSGLIARASKSSASATPSKPSALRRARA